MDTIISLGYEFISAFVPFVVVLILFRRSKGELTAPSSIRHFIMPTVIAIYVIAVFYVTNPGTIYDAMTSKWEHMKERINLVPFSNDIDIIGYILNIVMFVPLGFLVPLICRNIKSPIFVAAIGMSFSILIECGQLFSYRGTDIDDVILNTVGTLIGYVLYKVLDKKTNLKPTMNCISVGELLAYLISLLLGRFLFFNRVGLIELLLSIRKSR